MASDDSGILWDVVEEHLDEAEYIFGLWEESLASPMYTLAEIGEGPELRLRRHLEALVVGGDVVSTQLLVPVFEEDPDPPTRVSAAAMALFLGEERGTADGLLKGIGELPEPVRAAFARGLSACAVENIPHRLASALALSDEPSHQAALLSALEGHRFADVKQLAGALKGEDPELLRAALRLARHARRDDVVSLVESHVDSEDPSVRSEAIETGLILGVRAAWNRCVKDAQQSDGELRRRCLLLLALVGGQHEHGWIAKLVADDEAAPDAVWAAGFTGRRGAVEACLERLDDEKLGPLAGEAVAAIVGLDLEDLRYFGEPEVPGAGAAEGDVPLDEDDLDTDLSLLPEHELKVPNAEAIRDWWTQNVSRFDEKRRYVRGVPVGGPALVHELKEGPARRRHAYALEVAVRTRGAHCLPTDAFESVQRPLIDQMAGERIDGQAPFSRIS